MVATHQAKSDKRNLAALRSRRASAAAADIGSFDPPANIERRNACRIDLARFLREYFPHSTGLSPFGADQCRMIERIQRCILDGGRFANAMPRGFAKTTITENSTAWAVIYGHRRFVPIFSADADAANKIIDSIKSELETNDALYEDFPEVCHAIRALEGKSQRCRSQTYGGELTYIDWTAGQIVLPTIKIPADWPAEIAGVTPGAASPSAGGIIVSKGITGASRGMKHKRPDGTQQRPDFVILDDPQTEESAATALQVNKRLDTIRKSVLKLGGHNRQLAVILNGTVIQPDDLVDQLLDSKRNPAWQAERVAMVKKWADSHETFWLDKYLRARTTYNPDILDDQKRAHAAATDLYRANRAIADAGCEVSWDGCYDHDAELSAIQHAYNLLIDDGPEVFASECQNAPIKRVDLDTDFEPVPARDIIDRVSGIAFGILPLATQHLTAYIDVQARALFWAVGAFRDDFTGTIPAYGCFPDQGRRYFAYNEIGRTLQTETGAASIQGGIREGLARLTGILLGKEWKREDGVPMKISRCLVDSGFEMDVVNEFCRASPFAAVLMPAKGFGITAGKKDLDEDARKPGETVGNGWRVRVAQNRVNRYVSIDVNRWKCFLHERLRCAIGDPGAITLYGRQNDYDHRLIADHLSAEFCTKTEGRGRVVYEWQQRPERPDNHWLDCCVGALVAASMLGCSIVPKLSTPRKERKKLSDMIAGRGAA